MNTRTYMAIFLIAASIAIGTMSSIATQALAEKPDITGLEKADRNIHENTGSTPSDPSKQDLKFHEGTCQGGHTTEALENLGGCDILPAPGNSGDHP